MFFLFFVLTIKYFILNFVMSFLEQEKGNTIIDRDISIPASRVDGLD